MESDCDEIAAEPAVGPLPQRLHVSAAGSAACSAVGRLCLVLLMSCGRGLWHDAGGAGTSLEASQLAYPHKHAVGIGLCYWSLVHNNERDSRIPTPLLRLETNRCRAAQTFGYVAYSFKALARFEVPMQVDDSWSARVLMQKATELTAMCYDFESRQFGRASRVADIVNRWQEDYGCTRPKFLQFRFHCQWLAFIFMYCPDVFHAVSVGHKLARHRLCSKGDPSVSTIKRFIQESLRSASVVPVSMCKRRKRKHSSWMHAHDVHVLIEWLRFSRHVKDQNDSWGAMQCAARVIAKSTSRTYNEVLHDCRGVSGTVLKSARVRLDSVCMLLFRKLWQTMGDVAIYLYMDSSPQHLGGREMMAISMEILDLTGVLPFERKLLPVMSLARDFLDSHGKAVALLWATFLLVGPTYEQMARFLDNVVSVCSDMGAERLVAVAPDHLSDFFDIFLGMPGKPHRAALLPMALQAPGWNHGWDIIMKRGLQSLAWFPSCMELLRSIVHFFRCGLLVQALCKKVEERGFPIISSMISKVRIPSIAEWRWGTLHRACKQLSTIMDTLRSYWAPDLFANAKDAKTLRQVGLALNSVRFRWQFKFVHFFSSRIVRIQSWGKGSRALEAGLPVDPMSLGRRLSEAGPYVESAFRSMLSEAAEWDSASFEGASLRDIDCMKACVRASYTLAQDRHSCLNKIPWLFARLDQPGVAGQCVVQYESHSGHHALTEMIMKPGSALRCHVDQIQPDGSGASAELQKLIDVIKLVPFDDSVAETPHASGNRLGRHGSNSSFSWVASSMRLGQNLVDVLDHSQALGANLDELWYAHSSVLQTKPKALHRPMRCKHQVYRQWLYEVGRFEPPLQPTAGCTEAEAEAGNSSKVDSIGP